MRYKALSHEVEYHCKRIYREYLYKCLTEFPPKISPHKLTEVSGIKDFGYIPPGFLKNSRRCIYLFRTQEDMNKFLRLVLT